MKVGFQKRRLASLVAMVCMGLTPLASQAQLLEDVDVSAVTAEKGVELRIRFNVPVQYLRHSPLGKEPTDSVEIFFRVVSTEALSLSSTEETKKVASNANVPRFSVMVPRPDLVKSEARVILKFEKPVTFKVRSGGDGRSVVLELPGAAAPEAKQPASTPVVAAVVPPVTAPPAPVAVPVAAAPAPAPVPASTPASAAASAPVPAQPGPASVTPPALPDQAAIETQAKSLFDKARAALEEKQFDNAIEAFNQALNLPPNAQSRPAQEWIGVARERNGELAKAKAEYTLFTQLYPTGEDTERVKRRLAAVDQAQAAAPVATESRKPAKRERPEQPPEARIYGSWSSYYYWGNSHVETNTLQAGTTTPQTNTLDAVDQRSLINSLDLNYRYRDKNWDNRFVFRDTDTYDTLGRSRNRLSSLYYEQKNRPDDWLVRVGRQSVGQYSITGIMNRFDGLLGGWGITPRVRVNAAVGEPSYKELNPILAGALGKRVTSATATNWRQPFVAASVDVGPFDDSLSGSAYVIGQNTDGSRSRQAVGGELRYFKPKYNVYSLVDYDTFYRALNILMIQGNYNTENGVSYNALYDRRRSPLLQLTNALQVPENTLSIRDLVAASSLDQVKSNAKNATPMAESVSFGATKQLSQTWQVGGDIRLSRMGGTPAVASLTCGFTPLDPACGTPEKAAVAATGWDKSYSAQVIGNSLWLANDVGVLSLSYLDSATFYGLSPSASYRVMLDKWTLDGALRLYHQRSPDAGTTTFRWSPNFRASYKLKDNFTLEGEAGVEYSTDKNTSFDTTTDTRRWFATFGLRWDY